MNDNTVVQAKVEHCLGRVEEFPPSGAPVIRVVEGRRIGVYNIGGSFRAIRDRCPHAGATVCTDAPTGTYLPSAPGEYIYGMENCVIRCSAHGWEFDVNTGETLFGIDRRKLQVFPVSLRDGEVFVTMRTSRRADGTVD